MKYNGKEVTLDFCGLVADKANDGVRMFSRQYTNPSRIWHVLQAAEEVFAENAKHVQMIAVSDLTHTDLELERQAGHSEEWQAGFAAALSILGVEVVQHGEG